MSPEATARLRGRLVEGPTQAESCLTNTVSFKRPSAPASKKRPPDTQLEHNVVPAWHTARIH
eukprot:1901117-Alexandrium_andersonii.AAC.1